MSESGANFDSFADFAAEMQMLTGEAEREICERKSSNPANGGTKFAEITRPVVHGFEALSRATEELSARLQQMESTLSKQSKLPDVLATLKEAVDHKNYLNQQLFDALHAELKGYKDGLLLEILQKPIILDLISFFDDLEEVNRQVSSFAKESCSGAASEIGSRAMTLSTNLEHTLISLLEVLERMEVSKLEASTGQFLDKVHHRAVKVNVADSYEQDGEITESLRAGFMWKGRIVRPEQVTVKKYKKDRQAMISPEIAGAET
jgi:molecular chaperone GrpE (heat shock protein)